jgi:hypothetical protein
MTVDEVERWLEAKGVTLWADWFISEPDRRKLAAEWFVSEVEDFYRFAMPEPVAGALRPPTLLADHFTQTGYWPPFGVNLPTASLTQYVGWLHGL